MIWNAVIFGPGEFLPFSHLRTSASELNLDLIVLVVGPVADTPFEDGTFRLLMTFNENYPNSPPTVKFISKIFHPNVYANGELCLDILQNRWSPTYDVVAILTSVQSLLNDPNPNRWVWSRLGLRGVLWSTFWGDEAGEADQWVSFGCSPANAEAAQLYRENMKEYVRRVKVSRAYRGVLLVKFKLTGRIPFFAFSGTTSLIRSTCPDDNHGLEWLDPNAPDAHAGHGGRIMDGSRGYEEYRRYRRGRDRAGGRTASWGSGRRGGDVGGGLNARRERTWMAV